MLEAVFYARFLLERGPSIILQYPPSAIATSLSPAANNSLFKFSDIVSYIIPPYELCDRPSSVYTNGYRVLGFPVSLEDAKYERNRFTFNVCFVLRDQQDVRPWRQIVHKTANFFKLMEQDDELLQEEDRLFHLGSTGATENNGVSTTPLRVGGVVGTLLERILTDLNVYGEICVRVDDAYVLNLLLESPRLTPSEVRSWDVPLLIRALPEGNQWTWDLTLKAIHPHLNGINHVARIATLADVELGLVKSAVQELIHHDRAKILDIFHFQAIYTTTHNFTWFIEHPEIQDECRYYIAVEPSRNPFSGQDTNHTSHGRARPTRESVISLYASLTPGLTLHDFLLAHQSELDQIDVRRFITFGIIKGFLRRVHKYALLQTPNAATTAAAVPDLTNSSSTMTIATTASSTHERNLSTNTTTTSSPSKLRAGPPSYKKSQAGTVDHADNSSYEKDNQEQVDRAWRMAALSSGWTTPPGSLPRLADREAAAKMNAAGGSGGDGGSSSSNYNLRAGKSHDGGAGSLSRSAKSAEEIRTEEDEKIRGFLNGQCCLDQIGVEMGLSERKVVERLKSGRFGDVVLFCR